MKFDLILTNPPFQDSVKRGKTPHKLWIDFTLFVFSHLLSEGGTLAQVSPSSFQSPNSPVLGLMKTNQTLWLQPDASSYFSNVGSTFSHYGIRNSPNMIPTAVLGLDKPLFCRLDSKVLYLPTDLTQEGLSVHEKVIFASNSKLGVQWDYATCHNSKRKGVNPSLSTVPTDCHKHPVFHTNRKTWWSSVQQPWAGKKKVMWTKSGYTKPFYDPGTMGGTDMVYFVLVDGEAAGHALAHNLNLKLMRYIYQTAKWSGFGNERVFTALPQLPTDRKLSDLDLCSLFDLTPEEVDHVFRVVG